MQASTQECHCHHTCAFLRRPPVLPPKMGDGVLGSKVGGFQGVFSFFSSATALLKERALLGRAALLRSAVPLKALWRDGAAQRGAADIIVAAMAASQPVETVAGAQCSGSNAGPSEYLPRISGCLFWQTWGRRHVQTLFLREPDCCDPGPPKIRFKSRNSKR